MTFDEDLEAYFKARERAENRVVAFAFIVGLGPMAVLVALGIFGVLK